MVPSQARRGDVIRVRTAILAFVLAATFFLQAGVTLIDLISMILVVTAGILLLIRQLLAGAIVAIVGAVIIGGNASIKAIFNAAADPAWTAIQVVVGLLALALLILAVKQIALTR